MAKTLEQYKQEVIGKINDLLLTIDTGEETHTYELEDRHYILGRVMRDIDGAKCTELQIIEAVSLGVRIDCRAYGYSHTPTCNIMADEFDLETLIKIHDALKADIDAGVADGYRLADVDDVEVIDVYLDEVKHPRAFKTKLHELIESGLDEDAARKFIRDTPFVMEVYYDLNRGLFMVESEAVESTEIYNPYTGVECKKRNDF